MRYRFDRFIVDLDRHELRRDQAPVALRPKALRLLELLAERPLTATA